MSCIASGRILDLSELVVLKHPEALVEKIVSANKLSVTKFVCPEPGCGKSVDVYFRQDGKVRVRDHAAKGERVSMVSGGKVSRIGKTPTLASFAELVHKQEEARIAERTRMVTMAAEAVKSADTLIEAQVALIKQAEARIAEIQRDKSVAELLLADSEFSKYLPTDKAVGE